MKQGIPAPRGVWIPVIVGVILNPLNSSIIAVALPALVKHFGQGTTAVTWIVSSYYLGSAVAQPIFGRLGDQWGHRRFVYAGLGLLAVSAVAAPLSPSLGIFLVWRVAQAVATSMVYPNSIALVRRHFPEQLGRVLGWIGMGAGIAIAIGPPLGGLLMDWAGWHAIFWLNIPLAGLAALGWAILWPRLPTTPSTMTARTARTERPDGWGILFFTGAMTLWLLASTSLSRPAGAPALFLIAALVATVALLLVERAAARPLIPLGWFRERQLALASGVTVLSNVVMYSALYGLPLWIQTTRQVSAATSGLLLLVFAGTTSLASPWAGKMVQTRWRRAPMIGSGLLLVASAGILVVFQASSWFGLLAGLALMGLSFAISNVVLQQVMIESVPSTETGRASGVYMLLRYLGTMISSVLVAESLSRSGGGSQLFLLWLFVGLASTAAAIGLHDHSAQEGHITQGKL